MHDDAGVIRSLHYSSILQLSLRAALVDVGLRDKDWERDVVGADIRPGDVLSDALSSLPRLEASTVDAVYNSDVVKVDVRNVGESCLVLAKGADAHSVGLVTDCAALEKNIVCSRLHSNRIISVEDYAVGNSDVGGTHIEAVCVEGKTSGRGIGVDDRVADVNVVAAQLTPPRDRLSRLEMSN